MTTHDFATVCAATMVAGLAQIGLGLVRAGVLSTFIPSTVIRGMLAGIALMLVLKQLPHAIGYDAEAFDSDEFFEPQGENTFTALWNALDFFQWGAVLVSAISLALLIAARRKVWQPRRWMPAPLLVVIVATLVQLAMERWAPGIALGRQHLVEVPTDAVSAIHLPSPSAFLELHVWTLGLVIAGVASLESLLSIDAIDRIDPEKRHSDPNRELIAQGTANLVSGFLGALPVTSVIVRGSANASAGAKTRKSALIHGLFLLLAMLLLAPLLSHIPLAALATILILTGLDLANLPIVPALWKRGARAFVPFAATLLGILLTNLIIGVCIGIAVGLAFTVREAMRNAMRITDRSGIRTIALEKDAYFFHKNQLVEALHGTPEGTKRIVIARGQADFVSEEVREAIRDFEGVATRRGMVIELQGVPRASIMPGG
ncbi:MAG: SulP family inorganic anion transporter [Sandaracinus sp.]